MDLSSTPLHQSRAKLFIAQPAVGIDKANRVGIRVARVRRARLQSQPKILRNMCRCAVVLQEIRNNRKRRPDSASLRHRMPRNPSRDSPAVRIEGQPVSKVPEHVAPDAATYVTQHGTGLSIPDDPDRKAIPRPTVDPSLHHPLLTLIVV